MHFNIGNFLLLATFCTSCCSILFGGLAWKGKNWVVSKNDAAAGLNGICLTFFCVGYLMQIVGVLLLIFILLISIFQNSFARRWNFYVIFFITIITLFLMSFIIMILSAFYFVSLPEISSGGSSGGGSCNNKFTINFLKSHSFNYFSINIFCTIMVIGLLFFSLGYMSSENSLINMEDSDMFYENRKFQNKTISKNAFNRRKLTTHMVPSGKHFSC